MRTLPWKITAVVASLGLVAACSPTTTDTADGEVATAATVTEIALDSDTPEVWDSRAVHQIDVTYDEDDYDAMIETYITTGEKEWIEADVVIDGESYEDVGFKLKGNSSLRGLDEEAAESPEDLPWIINLDKFVDGQDHNGAEEFVIRSSSSESALNEAVALDLLDATGLAAEEAIATAFSANGSDSTLRLVVENPNTDWMERELGDGYMWKAESGGTWDYVGDDPDDYVESFDQEGGDDNYEPLIEFLDFINNSDDATFAEDLPEWLDVESFATYLAYQDLVGNADDINGPGNNAYLYWDIEDEQMTVVNWDLNSAYGATPEGAGDAQAGQGRAPLDGEALPDDAGAGQGPGQRGGGMPPAAGELPDGTAVPDGGELPDGTDLPAGEAPGTQAGNAAGGQPGGMETSNVLVDRFLAVDEFAAMYDEATDELQIQLYDSGLADEVLDTWTTLLTDNASELIDATTVQSDADALQARFPE
ncbi:CotH kinase family protein [Demequina sediminicola]|uniref:CotH kinase family protein n=1 Tax=Demequina sediminicola TaxID=1095026 RepID=UPI000784C76E|nr:CotH kinase family protein [Demequina sediminicola]